MHPTHPCLDACATCWWRANLARKPVDHLAPSDLFDPSGFLHLPWGCRFGRQLKRTRQACLLARRPLYAVFAWPASWSNPASLCHGFRVGPRKPAWQQAHWQAAMPGLLLRLMAANHLLRRVCAACRHSGRSWSSLFQARWARSRCRPHRGAERRSRRRRATDSVRCLAVHGLPSGAAVGQSVVEFPIC